MGTVNPRPRGGASLGASRREDRLDRQQIRRLLSTQPKPKVAASTGVAGVTRLTASDIAQTNAASPVGSTVTFSGYSITALFGDPISVTEEADGRITLPAGVYQAHAYVRLVWGSGSSVDEVHVSADFEGAEPFPAWNRRLTTQDGHGGGGPELRDSFSWGPFAVESGGWTFFGLNWQTSETAFLSDMALDVWRVG